MRVCEDEWERIVREDDVKECELVFTSAERPFLWIGTALRILVRFHPPRIMAYLKEELKKVVDVRVRWYGLFMLACKVLNRSLIEEILGEVEYEGNELIGPLISVCSEGNADLAKLFISKGAPVDGYSNERDVRTYRMEHTLDISSHFQTFLLVDPSYFSLGESLLGKVSYEGHVEVVRVLLSHGADVNGEDEKQRSPLHRAASKGHLEVVNLLLSHGASVNQSNKFGESNLYAASIKGHVDVVELLLSHGADVNQVDEYGWSPLFEASKEGHIKVVKVLISYGANVNLAADPGSPLFVAIENGHKYIVDLLISYGAYLPNPEEKDHSSFIVDEIY